jgi:hypothetical protein
MRVRIVGVTGQYLMVKSTSGRPPGYIASKDVAPIQERRASTKLAEKQRRKEEQQERWRAQEEAGRQEEAERLMEQRRQQEEQQQRETQRQREEMMNQGTDILRQLLYQGLGR